MMNRNKKIGDGTSSDRRRTKAFYVAIMQKMLAFAEQPPCVDYDDGFERLNQLLREKPKIKVMWKQFMEEVAEDKERMLGAVEDGLKFNPVVD